MQLSRNFCIYPTRSLEFFYTYLWVTKRIIAICFTKFLILMYKCLTFDRNDLWALGCTIYQMLSGSPPFQDKSEWLIFQRITERDLKFTDVFSNQAKDLIDKLLVRFILNCEYSCKLW